MLRTRGLCTIAITLLLGGRAALCYEVSFTPLGHLATGATLGSDANSVSADGSVVIGTSDNRCFRWTRESGVTEILDATGQFRLLNAYDVSGNGLVALGHSQHIESGVHRFFRWLPESADFDLLHSSLAASFDGSVMVGKAGIGVPGFTDAFRFEYGKPIERLITPPEYESAQADDVNGDGSVVVGRLERLNTTGQIVEQAAVWTSVTSPPAFLENHEQGYPSAASKISQDGLAVVGWAAFEEVPRDGQRAAVRWSLADGRMLVLHPDKDFESYSTGVSADGRRVVGSYQHRQGGIKNSFVWDESGELKDLQDWLMDLGLGSDLAGWSSLRASDISADGLTIVGNGLNPDGELEAFVATVPEPGAFSLVTALLLTGFQLVRTAQKIVSVSRRDEVHRAVGTPSSPASLDFPGCRAA